MGAYFGMELNAMAAMLYGQRAEPWHASADSWGSACQQLLATHGDLGAANAAITTWPQSIGSVSQAAFSGQVIGSLASLGEWAAYTGAMSAALRLGGTALYAAQTVMPALQSGYDNAVALSGVPIIGPFAAQVAVALQTVGAGMMETVGVVMQAPTAVPPPAQGWQGPGGGGAVPASPVPSASPATILDATDKLFGLFEKGVNLVQTVTGLAQSGSLGNAKDIVDKLPELSNLPHPDLPGLAGGVTAGAPTLSSLPTASPALTGGISPGAIAGVGTLGAVVGATALRATGQQAPGVPGARIGVGTEPALAGGTARAAAGAPTATPAIAPPMSPAAGGGGTSEARSGGRQRRDDQTGEQEERLRRSGVQTDLQGRAARESTEQFGLPSVRRRRPGADGSAVLDEEVFIAESRRD